MTTKIEISNLKIQAFHGALPQEHIVGNSYSIDLTITTDFSAAMVSDNLEDTISYAEAAEIIKTEMLIPSQLLEHVAGRIITHLQARWGNKIQGIDLKISKLSPPVGLDIESCSIHIIV